MKEQVYKVLVNENGTFWFNYVNKLHRLNGPAIEQSNGTKSWWVNGKRHRLDGPAIERFDGTKEWWVDGKRHRLDGPAVERANGDKAWWINGMKYTETEWKELTNPKTSSPNVYQLFWKTIVYKKYSVKTDTTCENKTIIVDGKKYKLTPVD